MTEAAESKVRTLGTRWVAVLILFGIGGLVLSLGRLTLSRHEVFAAEPAREMLEGGTWLVQSFAGEPRLAKPPTMSWLIAGSFATLGRSEFSARLPSGVSGILLGLIVATVGSRFCGRAFGGISGLMTLTSYYALRQGQLAEADLPMTAAIAGALGVFAVACVLGRAKPQAAEGGEDFDDAASRHESVIRAARRTESVARATGWSAAFYALVGLSFLFKGVGPLVILPACVGWMIWGRKRFREDVVAVTPGRLLLNPVGLMVGLAICLAWPVVAWWHYPAIRGVWWFEIVGRMTGTQEGRAVSWGQYGRTFFDYVPMTLLLVAPWTPAVLICLFSSWRSAVLGSRLGRFGVCWFVPGFVLFTLIAWRHQHYIMPVMPPLAWAGAWGAWRWIEWRKTRPIPRGAALVVCGLVAAGATYAIITLTARGHGGVAGMVAVAGLATVIVVLLDEARRPVAGVLATAGATLLASILLHSIVLPPTDAHEPVKRFAQAVNRVVPDSGRVTLLGLGEAQIAFYLDKVPERWDDDSMQSIQEMQMEHMARMFTAPNLNNTWWILCDEATLPTLREAGRGRVDVVARGTVRKQVREDESETTTLVLVWCGYNPPASR